MSTGVIFILGKGVSPILASGVKSTWPQGSSEPGFSNQLNENSKLKDVEWLYRYERGLHTNPNVVMHRERLMLHGKPHEVDSLKSLIRYHEQRLQADTTFSYYYPSNP